MTGLQPGHLTVRLRGSAGQSLGAFAVQGLKLEVFGDANDYVGKGLSGATIVVRPAPSSTLRSQREHDHRQHRALWRDRRAAVRGRPGGRALRRAQLRRDRGGRRLRLERLRIHDRRHGGDPGPGRRQFRRRHDRRHGVRLRRGRAVRSCGSIPRRDVAARRASALGRRCCATWSRATWRETTSRYAARLLHDWDRELPRFWQVVPKEYVKYLPVPLDRAGATGAARLA